MSTPLRAVILHGCGQILKTEEERDGHVCPIVLNEKAKAKEYIDPEKLERTKENRCPHCGAKMEKKKHLLNRGLVKALRVTIAGVKAQDKNDIAFGDIPWDNNNKGFNLRQNFQKLRYFGLVAHPRDENGKRIWGRWLITKRGGQFLRGEISVYSFVVSYRNHVIERSETFKSIVEVENDHTLSYYQTEFAYEKPMPDYDDSDAEEPDEDEDL